jgi:hypothetical protein
LRATRPSFAWIDDSLRGRMGTGLPHPSPAGLGQQPEDGKLREKALARNINEPPYCRNARLAAFYAVRETPSHLGHLRLMIQATCARRTGGP